jgi:hypothetical protein
LRCTLLVEQTTRSRGEDAEQLPLAVAQSRQSTDLIYLLVSRTTLTLKVACNDHVLSLTPSCKRQTQSETELENNDEPVQQRCSNRQCQC